MGYRFELGHGNVVVYLTTPAAEPPRLERHVLREFLGAMLHGADRPWMHGGRVLTRDMRWPEQLRAEARLAMDLLGRRGDDVLAPEDVARILSRLRALLSQFRLFAIPIWSGRFAADNLLVRAEYLALDTDAALVLFPEAGLDSPADAGLDALPAFELALQHQAEWPGALLWTARGGAAFVPARHIEDAFSACHMALRAHDDVALERAVSDIARATGHHTRRILHLSDLHFGSRHAAINAPFLAAELHETVRIVDRVVVTGDLFDSPKAEHLAEYERFAQELHRTSGHEPICIPGNHDMRWLGNSLGGIGSTSTQVAALRWSSHVVDDRISTVFLGFNSAVKGYAARGEVGQDQMMRIAAQHRNAIAVRPELRGYLTIALVHHHPYTYDTPPTTLVQRTLAKVHVGDEKLMRLADADEYVNWCARWGVSVILHGHKHDSRYEVRTIQPDGSPAHVLPAVGCGSSLGAEGSPLSYCILSWDDARRRWSTSFFESRAGGPFTPKLITITRDASTTAAEAA